MMGSGWILKKNIRGQSGTKKEATSHMFSPSGILRPSLTKELSFEISLLLAVGPRMDFKAVATENKAFRILYMGYYDG